MTELANQLGVATNLLIAVLSVFGALIAGSIVRIVSSKLSPHDKVKDRYASLRTWWILVVLFGSAVVLGPIAVAVLFATASFLGLREYSRMTAPADKAAAVKPWIYAVIPLHYTWIVLGWFEPFWVTIPVMGTLVIAASGAAAGTTKGFVRDVTAATWGLLLIVFSLSHVAMLFALPASSNSVAGNAGWILYLVLLTESNDISQALWGRQLGKRKVTPGVSPHKTWEGLLLGIATTIVLAVVLAPLLTPLHDGPNTESSSLQKAFPQLWSILAGALIGASGFFGDITMSAVKRDAGVKDSSQLLPGQGGMLDRIDSLTFTAPVMFYYVYWLFS